MIFETGKLYQATKDFWFYTKIDDSYGYFNLLSGNIILLLETKIIEDANSFKQTNFNDGIKKSILANLTGKFNIITAVVPKNRSYYTHYIGKTRNQNSFYYSQNFLVGTKQINILTDKTFEGEKRLLDYFKKL